MTPDLCIRGAVLVRPPFDSAAAMPADVVVAGGRIVAIYDSNPHRWPEATRVLDARGGFLMPGLIDAHAHLTGSPGFIERWLRAYLKAGVTTVREAGARDDAAFELVRRRADLPPRILTAGGMLGASNDEDGRSMTQRAEAAVRAGACWLKAYALPPDQVRAVAAVAARHGLPVAAHLGSAARESVRQAGLPAVEHIFSLLEYDLVDAETRRRAAIPSADAPIGTWLLADPSHGPLAEWVAELGERRVTITPTLTVMAPLVGRPPGRLDAIHPEEAPWATAEERNAWRERLKEFGWWIVPRPAARARRARVLRRFDEVVLALHEAGCPIAAGTDFGNPFIEAGRGLIAELRTLLRAGLPLPAVLEAATSVPATLLGRSGVLGELSVGAAADLLLLDADPRRSVDALERIRSVVAAGQPISLEDHADPLTVARPGDATGAGSEATAVRPCTDGVPAGRGGRRL